MRLPVADRPAVRQAMLELVTRERRAGLIVLLLHSLAAVSGLAAPWLLGKIVDAVSSGAHISTVDKFAVAIGVCVLVQGFLLRCREGELFLDPVTEVADRFGRVHRGRGFELVRSSVGHPGFT